MARLQVSRVVQALGLKTGMSRCGCGRGFGTLRPADGERGRSGCCLCGRPRRRALEDSRVARQGRRRQQRRDDRRPPRGSAPAEACRVGVHLRRAASHREPGGLLEDDPRATWPPAAVWRSSTTTGTGPRGTRPCSSRRRSSLSGSRPRGSRAWPRTTGSRTASSRSIGDSRLAPGKLDRMDRSGLTRGCGAHILGGPSVTRPGWPEELLRDLGHFFCR